MSPRHWRKRRSSIRPKAKYPLEAGPNLQGFSGALRGPGANGKFFFGALASLSFPAYQAKTPSASLDAGRSFAETIQVMISVKLINSVSFKKLLLGLDRARALDVGLFAFVFIPAATAIAAISRTFIRFSVAPAAGASRSAAGAFTPAGASRAAAGAPRASSSAFSSSVGASRSAASSFTPAGALCSVAGASRSAVFAPRSVAGASRAAVFAPRSVAGASRAAVFTPRSVAGASRAAVSGASSTAFSGAARAAVTAGVSRASATSIAAPVAPRLLVFFRLRVDRRLDRIFPGRTLPLFVAAALIPPAFAIPVFVGPASVFPMQLHAQ